MQRETWMSEAGYASGVRAERANSDPARLARDARASALSLAQSSAIAFVCLVFALLILALGYGCPTDQAGAACGPGSVAGPIFAAMRLLLMVVGAVFACSASRLLSNPSRS